MVTVLRYADSWDEITTALRTRGGLGAILIDIVDLERVERAFGRSAYESLRARIESQVREACERNRPNDILVAENADHDRFLLFLTGDRLGHYSAAEHRHLADRIHDSLAPRIARIWLRLCALQPAGQYPSADAPTDRRRAAVRQVSSRTA
jgi:hypothetical protein